MRKAHKALALIAGRRPSPALVMASAALLVAIGTPAWALSQAATTASHSTVHVVIRRGTVSNNGVLELAAKCPSGTKVFSGGVATTGQHVRWVATAPARSGNQYLGYSYIPPANINAGITRETAHNTVVAYCAEAGKPIVP